MIMQMFYLVQDNPYEMFWVHYNNIRHANLQNLFDKSENLFYKTWSKRFQ